MKGRPCVTERWGRICKVSIAPHVKRAQDTTTGPCCRYQIPFLKDHRISTHSFTTLTSPSPRPSPGKNIFDSVLYHAIEMNSTTISTGLTSRALHELSKRGNPLTPVVSGIVAAVCRKSSQLSLQTTCSHPIIILISRFNSVAIVVFVLNIVAVGFCVFYMFQGSRYYRRQVQLLDEESKKLVRDEENATDTIEHASGAAAVAAGLQSDSRAIEADHENPDDVRRSAWKTNSGLFLLKRMKAVRQTSNSRSTADLEGDCMVTVKSPTVALYKQALTAGPAAVSRPSLSSKSGLAHGTDGMQVSVPKPDEQDDGLFVSSDRSRMSFWKRDSVSRFEPMDSGSLKGSFRGQAV